MARHHEEKSLRSPMMNTRLECHSAKSAKFWEVSVNGDKMSVRFGRIDTAGQTRTKLFTDFASATEAAEKLIRQKLSKGYRPVEERSPSRGFAIAWEDALERLERHLEPASFELIEAYANECAEDEPVLWIDQRWDELDYKEIGAEGVALAVFAEPLTCEGPIALDAGPLLGDISPGDRCAFVFLAEVRAEALTTVPDTTAVFAGGLRTEGAACFSAADAFTHVATHLRAKLLFCDEGTLCVAPHTVLALELVCGAFGGTTTPEEVLPFLAETIEDDSVAAALWELRKGYTSVPEDFVWPGEYRAPLTLSQPSKPDVVFGRDAYLDHLPTVRMSVEARELLEGMHDYLLEGNHAARFVSALPSDMHKVPERIVFVRDRIAQTEALSLGGRGDDGWSAYVFLKGVHCGDVSLEHNVVAIFLDSLTARVVTSDLSDSHLLVAGLNASVVCGNVYIRRRSSLELGVLAGGVVRLVDPAELVPEWTDELDQDVPLWELFSRSFEEFEPLETLEEPRSNVEFRSRFQIEWSEVQGRLKEAKVPEIGIQSLAYYMRHHGEGSAVLWVNEPWSEIDYEAMDTDTAVGLVVFAAPFEYAGTLTLSAEQLAGDTQMRDHRAFVFLDEVRVGGLTTLPDTLTIFAGGLDVKTSACFSAPDATTGIASHLYASCVVSGNSDGGVDLWGKPKMRVATVVGSMPGSTSKTRKRTPEVAFPQWSAALEEGMGLWELFVQAFDEETQVLPKLS